MANDPVPFQFPPAAPFAEPPAEEFREPKPKRGPRKVKILNPPTTAKPKKRGPKPGSKRKPKQPPPEPFSPHSLVIGEVQKPLSFAEAMDALNKMRAIINAIHPTQRKELLTYLLGQQ